MADQLSPDQILVMVACADTEEEIRAAIKVAAAFLRERTPDPKLVHALQELMNRVEAAGIRFGQPHGPGARAP